MVKNTASKVSRGSKVTITNQDPHWLIRSAAELQEARNKDVRQGRFHDDGGEPILYGPYTGFYGAYGEDVYDRTYEVEVTSLRPKWLSWNRRPKGLTEGFCKELNRVVLFKRPV